MDTHEQTATPPPAAPVKENAASAEQLLARHQQTLQELFPLPDLGKLKRKAKATRTLALALVGLAAGVIAYDPAYQTSWYQTTVGQQQTIALADGSQLTLDTDAALLVSWHVRTRQVRLVRGAALFQVSPRIYRPFSVTAQQTTASVVGTRFGVRLAQDQVSVTVAEGRVRVANHDAEVTLQAGQQVMALGARMQPVQTVDADNVLAWSQGRFYFERTPLKDVLKQVQRYRHDSIVLDQRSLGELEVSGVFHIANTDELLQLLPAILPVRVQRLADGATHIMPAADAGPH